MNVGYHYYYSIILTIITEITICSNNTKYFFIGKYSKDKDKIVKIGCICGVLIILKTYRLFQKLKDTKKYIVADCNQLP